MAVNAIGLAGCSVAAEGPTAYRTYHFSDCQEGAAAGCVPGDNSNRGTAESPKQNLAGLDVNSLPAGTRLLFKRGGAWANVALRLENTNATPTAPLVFDAYGTGAAAPLLRSSGGNAISVGGGWGNTGNDGGYLFRNLRLDGTGKSDWGVWLVQNVRNVTLESMDISGFKIGVHSSQGQPHGITSLVVKNSRIHRNASMGMLGAYTDSVIDGNTFEANNFSGSNMNHAIYLSGGSRNTIRGNTFTANSTVDGVCQGGNVTAHGLIDGLLIEGNTIRQTAAKPSCYGFAITVGYESAEEFRNVVVRGNTIINVGMTAIAANAAPGILVEGNKIINTQDTAQYGIWIPANRGPSPDDAQDRDAVVRNNTLCYANADKGAAVSVKVPGAQVSNNTIFTGAAAKTCESRPMPGK